MTMPSSARRWMAVVGVVIVTPVIGAAQSAPPTAWGRGMDAAGSLSGTSAAWLGAWSPLRPMIEAPRSLLRAPLAPGVLDAPPPPAGAFIIAGAPGAIARDLARGDSARYRLFEARTARDNGEFRRPLDVGESEASQFAGVGWSRVAGRGVAIGRFVVDREHAGLSSYTPRVSPYSSSPIVMTDSVRPPMDRTRARFEGAIGVTLADLGLGVSAGVDLREHNSVDFPLRRSGRAATPAAAAGAEYVLPWFGARAGAWYAWSEPNETNTLNAVPLPTIIYAIQGYDEPFGITVSHLSPLFVRNDRRATAVGGSLDAEVYGARVVVTHESGSRADDQNREPFIAGSAVERWRAEGAATRFQVQRTFVGMLLATLVAVTETYDGRGSRSDLDGIAFLGRDTRRAVEAELRASLGTDWMVAGGGGVVQTHHGRIDYAAELLTDLNVRTPFVSAEAARRVGRVWLALGGSAAAQVPLASSLPVVEDRGPNYQRLIAPDLAYTLAEARAHAWWVNVAMPVRGSTFLLGVRQERTTPHTAAPERLQPQGDRSGWSVSLALRR